MFDTQEWIEKQWPSMMFFDPRVHFQISKKIHTSFSVYP